MADLVDLLVRRLGQDRTHAAHVPADVVTAAVFAGREYRSLPAPIVVRCGAVLRGQLVVMDGGVASAKCSACVREIVLAEQA